jgi:hypothetical protein
MRTVDQGFPPLKWFLKHVIKKETFLLFLYVSHSFFLTQFCIVRSSGQMGLGFFEWKTSTLLRAVLVVVPSPI